MPVTINNSANMSTIRLRETIIENYVDAYNHFDIARMVIDFAPNIQFENISNGVTNISLQGLPAFIAQAQQAKNLFTARNQTIKLWTHRDETTEVEIAFSAVLAADLPNGLKKGERIDLGGKSVFTFSDSKIVRITDIS